MCPADPEFGGSSNGRTADSDSACLGSNPSPPANKINELSFYKIHLALFWLFFQEPFGLQLAELCERNSALRNLHVLSITLDPNEAAAE